jgi:hypothetical protein
MLPNWYFPLLLGLVLSAIAASLMIYGLGPGQ